MNTKSNNKSNFEKNIQSFIEKALIPVELLPQYEYLNQLPKRLQAIQTNINQGVDEYNKQYPTGGYQLSSITRQPDEIKVGEQLPVRNCAIERGIKNYLAYSYHLRKYKHFTLSHLKWATNRLEKLYSFLLIAQAELSKVPKQERESYVKYEGYLEQLGKKLKKEGKSLAKRIYSSCMMALEAGNINQHQVANKAISQAQKMGYLSSDFTQNIPKDEEPLDFANAFYWIIRFGCGVLKRRVSELFSLQNKNNEKENIIPLKQVDRTVLIPVTFLKYIPTKPRWPSWLFRGHQERYNFFKDKTPILFKLLSSEIKRKNQGKSQSISFETFLKNARWQQLIDLGKEIKQAEQEAEQKKANVWPFQRTTKALIHEWQGFLSIQKKNILRAQIEILNATASSPKPSQWLKKEKPVYSAKEIEQIEKTLQQFNNTIKASEPSAEDIKTASKAISEILKRCDKDSELACWVKFISAKTIVIA